jgi:hypothetical protein
MKLITRVDYIMTKKYEKPGQPTKYTKALADKICKLVSTNSRGLTTLIKENKLPDRQTIYNWLNTYAEFFDSYMQAKRDQAHVLADEILEVANNIRTHKDKDGNERIDAGILGQARLQVVALQWSAARLAPKWYGENKHEETKNTDMLQELVDHKNKLDEKNKKEF